MENSIFTNAEAVQQEQMAGQQDQQQNTQALTMTDKLIALRQQWTSEVEAMNESLKNLVQVDHLLNSIYIKRQKAVDLYYGTYGVYNKQLRIYKSQYASAYNAFKNGQNNIRYTSDSAINVQIEAQLSQQKEIIDELKNFLDFMWETVKTIDNLCFGINHKLKIAEIQNGLKY